MQPEALVVAQGLGSGDEGAHKARQIDAHLIQNSNLVLTMEREHRRFVAQLLPSASRYTFTLREFARLIDYVARDQSRPLPVPKHVDNVGRLISLAGIIASRRGFWAPVAPDEDDVVDPIGSSRATYERSAREIADALRLVEVSAELIARRLLSEAT
jgi:protein-tyrosine phosphatase